MAGAQSQGSGGAPAAVGLAPEAIRRAIAEGVGDIRYTVQLEGLGGLGDAEELARSFRQQSALEAERKHPANAAQIGRRAKADADLLTQLLRAQGYYDADVEPRTEKAGDALRVVLTVEPGQQYRFASVELPGLEAAGADSARAAGRVRRAFGRSRHRRRRDRRRARAHPVARRGGICRSRARRPGHRGQSPDPSRDIELPVNPVRSPVSARSTSAGNPTSARIIAIIARFKRGDPFKRSKVDDLRRALIATTLVANADIRVVPVQGGRIVDLDVRLEPAPSHTIAGELGYGTGQGARVKPAGPTAISSSPKARSRSAAIAGTTEQLLGVQFRRSNFLQRDQTLEPAGLGVAPEVRRLTRRGPSISRPISSGRATSSGRRNGPGPTAASGWRPTSAACSAAPASRIRGRSSSPRCR